MKVIEGDCVEVMAAMEPNSVDAIVTDPPYGLEFMGKEWDKLAGTPGYNEKGRMTPASSGLVANKGFNRIPNSYQAGKPMQAWHERWAREALRVLKPGGHLVAFGGTRTYHRMVCAIEDAGFEIRDSLHWVYGSGFPKSLDVSKQIDKMAGAEREVVGFTDPSDPRQSGKNGAVGTSLSGSSDGSLNRGEPLPITTPATPEAEQWQGWGTALKPAHEPIVLARKPLSEKNVASNVLAYSTGALKIDGCRVAHTTVGNGNLAENTHLRESVRQGSDEGSSSYQVKAEERAFKTAQAGRWPPNLLLSHSEGCVRTGTKRVKATSIHGESTAVRRSGGAHADAKGHQTPGRVQPVKGYADPDGTEAVEAYECAPDCPVRLMDEQSGQSKSPKPYTYNGKLSGGFTNGDIGQGMSHDKEFGDKGGASRFFPNFSGEPFKYTAKASRRERNAGLEGMPMVDKPLMYAERPAGNFHEYMNPPGRVGNDGVKRSGKRNPSANTHPTVKPIDLMRWLVRLVTPPGGTVLDPFCGSGSTGCAAVQEGMEFIGIEMDAEYAEIARRRIAHWSGQGAAPRFNGKRNPQEVREFVETLF